MPNGKNDLCDQRLNLVAASVRPANSESTHVPVRKLVNGLKELFLEHAERSVIDICYYRG